MKSLALLFVVFSVAGCGYTSDSVDTSAEAEKLMGISRQWSDVAGSGDLEATLAYWADDAVMMVPGQSPLRGKDAIRTFVESSSAIPGFNVKWEPIEAHVSPSGEMAYLIERNLFSYQDSTGATASESNKVVTVWRKQPDGSWKNVIDMWNSDPSAWK